MLVVGRVFGQLALLIFDISTNITIVIVTMMMIREGDGACFPIRVDRHPQLGRRLVATRDIKKGEVTDQSYTFILLRVVREDVKL